MINKKAANATSGYIQTLYKMNQKCLLLCGVDFYNDLDYITDALDLICDIPRIIPYDYDEENGIHICKRDGLLEFDSEFGYLIGEYTKIIDANNDLLDRIRCVRNKHEHKMHDVQWRRSSNGSLSLLEMEFEVSYKGSAKRVTISVKECVHLLEQLNLLFDRIAEDVQEYAEANGKTKYPFYEKLCQHEFKSFNIIYDSPLLTTVGKIVTPY